MVESIYFQMLIRKFEISYASSVKKKNVKHCNNFAVGISSLYL